MFEIGVGPGYLFSILRGLGVEMSGCDVPEKENPAFYELRKELGIADLTHKLTLCGRGSPYRSPRALSR